MRIKSSAGVRPISGPLPRHGTWFTANPALGTDFRQPTVSIGLSARSFDVIIALALIILAAPVFIALAGLVKLSSRGPVLFTHMRIGQNGRLFGCLKFRTMRQDADEELQELLRRSTPARREWASTQKLRHDPRVTRVGFLLRRSSLDELPQLFNVLFGDMSIVGPRPIVEEEVVRYGRHFGDYCSVRPGITGLWQVSGRNNTSYRRRVALDMIYVRSRSFWLNLRILLWTVPVVLLRKGSC